MRIFEEFCMPKWIAKHFPVGQEDQAVSEVIVPIGIFTICGIVVLCCKFYGSKWITLALLISCVYWILVQSELLKKRRNKSH